MKQMKNRKLNPFASKLRKEMTEEERRLWYGFLKQYPVRFMRQKIIGKYIVDFYCAKAKLVIELDGSQHYEDAGERADMERADFLATYGLEVIHFSNPELNRNFSGICEYIDMRVKERMRGE